MPIDACIEATCEKLRSFSANIDDLEFGNLHQVVVSVIKYALLLASRTSSPRFISVFSLSCDIRQFQLFPRCIKAYLQDFLAACFVKVESPIRCQASMRFPRVP